MTEFLMPKLGADMTEGKLVAWRKQAGDRVQRGDIVAEIDTDKGVIDVEVFTSGVFEKLVAQPGDVVPVGAVMAIIRETDEGPAPAAAAEATLPAAAVQEVPPPRPRVSAEGAAAGRVAISPSARRLARQLGVDPARLVGTGPSGVITRQDVERAAAAGPPAARASIVPPATPEVAAADRRARIRQVIAAAMSRSKREIPHYYLSTTIDLGRALQWLAKENEARSTANRLLYGALLIKAVALALRELPEFNSVWDGASAAPAPHIHVGIAISLRDGGLIAPAIHDTDQQSLDALMKRFRDLVLRARTGSLRSSELSDPTITVTNLGEQGVEAAFGVIYPPQSAIVGFGRIVERPCVIAGQIVARPVITASLSADHRLTDGHRGGLFLMAIERLLQEPEKL
jgi:pyruvate dehydrogenase E2 component (dihydrolipoamide acetyltransferase)